MNMNMKIRYYLCLLYIAGCAAYAGYEAYSYTGLYRLAAEWQMETFGSYDERLTFLAPFMATVIPGIVTARLLGWEINAREARTELTSPGFLLAAGLTLLAVAAGAGWHGYGKITEKIAFDAFDLSKSAAPPSDHVVMTGIAHPEYQVEFGTKRKGTASADHYYVPVTAANWRRGDPLVYFITTGTIDYTPPEGGKSYELSGKTPPFPLTSKGVLVTGGLPGPVAEYYRKSNIALAPAPVLLDSSPWADADPYFITASVTGVGGVYCLLYAAIATFRRRRQAKA
jgi:hypothetical protein